MKNYHVTSQDGSKSRLLLNLFIIKGHYGCGGVTASLSTGQHGIVDNWLRTIKDIYRNNKQDVDSCATKKDCINRLVELNVIRQVNNIASTAIVQEAWANGRKLEVHGWVYDLETGRLKDLECNIRDPADICDDIYVVDCECKHNHADKEKTDSIPNRSR